ncbi:MAG: alpha/beta fold hydrolase [Caldilineaceae bacterium]
MMTKREMIAKTPSAARRRLLSALGLLTLGAVAGSCVAVQGAAPEGSTPRRPIVLVAGGWQGGWCWQKVTPLLSAAGHRVYTPTLTGLGDRAHLSQPTIDLEMHSQDLVAFLDMEDLQDVVLVGHSYAGFVISAVAERARQAPQSGLSRCLYPRSGQTGGGLSAALGTPASDYRGWASKWVCGANPTDRVGGHR